MICRVLFIGHPAKALFAECQTRRHPAKKCTRQTSLCRVPGTRQSLAFGKKSSFAECYQYLIERTKDVGKLE
jgi:hypothetical protein